MVRCEHVSIKWRVVMDASLVYLGVAVIGGLLALVGLVVFFRSHFRPDSTGVAPGESGGRGAIPTAPLQRRAWWGLGIGVVATVLILSVFFTKGVASFHEERGTRLLVLGIFLAGVAAYLIAVALTHHQTGGEILMDERDRMIMNRAPAVQLIAVLISLAIWSIVLTEMYWDQGAVPIVYPYLIFWSVFIVNILAGAVGILLGYRRM
jgi:uncharacterized membrane protein